MNIKQLSLAALFCCFSLLMYAQGEENTSPTYTGKISSLEYVTSLASRPGDLTPIDRRYKEAKDRRSLGQQMTINEDPQKKDDYFVRNKNPMSQSRSSSPPSIVFDAYSSTSQPTDPSMAVGPNHVMVVFNTGFAIYDKVGNELVGETSPNPAIFPSGGCCDLTATYDNAADRWVLSFLGGGAQVAVSDGPDPVNDGWFIYTIAAINDYQKLSLWSDGYYMTDNTGSSNKVWAMERDQMLAGDPDAQIIGFDLPGITTSGFYSPQGFNVTDGNLPAAGGAPIVYMQDDAWGGVADDHLKIWTIDVDWADATNSTISAPVEIPTTPFISVFDGGSFSNLTQPDGGSDVDALQATIMNQAQFRKFEGHNSAVFNFVVDTDASAGELAGIRWFELRQDGDNMPWSLYQEGTYTSPDGKHAWHGSLSMDGLGNIAMGYTAMSGPTTPTTTRISSYYTGRMDGDPLNTMTSAEQLIAAGDANIPGFRYGDYNKIEVDPVDDATFWFINEYMNDGRSGVVGVFTLEPPIPDFESPTDPTNLVASDITHEGALLNWTASTDNVGVTQYNIFIDGVQVGTSSTNSYVVTGLDPLTTYSAAVTAQDAAGNISTGSATTSFTTLDPPPPSYCDSNSTADPEEFIARVQLNSIDNTSGPSNYSDFTAVSTDLNEGETYTITITSEFPTGLFDEGYGVWIDYNNDFDFDDAGELVWSAGLNQDLVNEGMFTVPTGTSMASVRMRVAMSYAELPTACGIYDFGEVEDYTINLQGDEPCEIVDSNDGESGWGIWNDGGEDAGLINNATYANSGTKSFLIKDNTSTSVITTDDMNLISADVVEIDFTYITVGFNSINHDYWLQVSTDGGATFNTVETWTYTVDFVNNEREFESVTVGGPFTANTQFRFRCDAAANNDKVYIDDIVIQSCASGSPTCDDGIQNGAETGVDCGGPDCLPCDECEEFDFNDVEAGWGIWNDGGDDAARVNNATFANSGTFSFLIKDNTNTSVITTDNIDLSGVFSVEVDFNFVANGFNGVEDFWLQVSTDGGGTFTTVEEWNKGDEFENDIRVFDNVYINQAFSSTTQFRFRCDASGNNDKLYIDDISLRVCDTPTGANTASVETRVSPGAKLIDFTNESLENIMLYPNPAQTELTIEILEGHFTEISLFSSNGQIMQTVEKGNNKYSIDVSDYAPGMYFVRFVARNGLAVTKRFTKD